MITRIIISFILAILMIGCNIEEKVSIEDAEFDNYFYESKNIPVVKGQILNLSRDEISSTQVQYTMVTPFEADRFHITKLSQLKYRWNI